MKKALIILTIIAAPLLLAIGSNPRYIEEIAWGGGYGSTGGWLEADGDILTEGTVTATGGTVATAVTSNTSYTVNIDEDNNSTSETFAIETNASGTDLFTVTEAGNATVAGTLSNTGAATLSTTTGTLSLGADDSVAGIVDAYGSGSTSGGGYRMRNGLSVDDEVNLWAFLCSSGGDFQIGGFGGTGNWGALLTIDDDTGDATYAKNWTSTGNVTINGIGAFGNASTDTFTLTGRLILRSVTDAGMASTAGSAREILYNSSDSRFYGSLAGGSPATDWGYFLRNTDATQVLKNTAGVTLSLKDSDSTAGTSTISAEGTSGASTTYGGAITFTAGGGVAIYQDPSPTNTSNNRIRNVLYGAGSALTTFGDNTTAAAEAHVELQRSSDSVPAVLEIESADGTASYFFAGNNGTLRQHTAAPTADTDGRPVAGFREWLSAKDSNGDASTAAVGATGVYGAFMDDAIASANYFQFAMPSWYTSGTLTYRVHIGLESTVTAGQAPRLTADAGAASANDVVTSTASSLATIDDSTSYLDGYAATDLYIWTFTGNPTGLAAGDLVSLKIGRSGTHGDDTYPDGIYIIGVEITLN